MGLPYQQWFAPPAAGSRRSGKDLMTGDKGYGSGAEDRIKIGKQIHQMALIRSSSSHCRPLTNYGIRLAKNNLANQPGRVINAAAMRISDNLFPFMFYYK